MIYFMIIVDTCIVNNITQTKVFMIGRQAGDYRPYDGRYPVPVCRRFFDKLSSTDRLAIVGRLTPDDRRPSADIMMKKSSKRRPIVGRSSVDHRPTLHR